MADTLRVVRREFTYPDAASIAIVREAGGISKLTPEQRKHVTFKHVAVGDDCSDMPAESIALRLERGEIERVSHDTRAPTEAEWADLGRPKGQE